MSASADKFGSISTDSYRSPGTVTGSATTNFTQTAQPAPPANTEINRHELTRVYDPYSQANVLQATKSGFSHTDPAPQAPNKTKFGRDPYKSAGMPGETYLDNANGPSSTANAPVSDGGPAVL